MSICTSCPPKQEVQESSPSCCQAKPTSSSRNWQKVVDLICRLAIGVFCAVLSPLAFAASFGLGIALGATYAISRICQNKPMFPDGQSKPVCAQGYMDFLSGMRFPPTVGTLATTAFIGAHMRHDPQFYVPFCGLFLGFWIGREAAQSIRDIASWKFELCLCGV